MPARKSMDTVSIIVPAWREEHSGRLVAEWAGAPGVEVVMALAEGDRVTVPPEGVTVVRAPRGRATQMNAGAKAATGGVYLFLHADTAIPIDSIEAVRETLARPGVAGGAYSLAFDSGHPWLRLIAAVANLRSRLLGLPYGDQAIFVDAETFKDIGGFENVPILEDVLLVRALKRRGRLALLDRAAVTSARRWQKGGMLKTTMRNYGIMAAHWLGASPHTIAKWFKR